MKRTWICVLGLLLVMLTGCQGKTEVPKDEKTGITESAKADDNPFDLEAIEKSGQIIEASYGWVVGNYDPSIRRIDLAAESSANLKMEISCHDTCEVGYLILIDGIPQKYCIGEEEGYVIPVNCEAGDSYTNLQFTPTVQEMGEEHTMNFVCLYHPSFRTSEEEPYYGNYHSMSQLLPWKISGEVFNTETAISKNVTYQSISEEIKEQYVRVNRDGTMIKQYENLLHSKFYQNGTEAEQLDGTENIQLVMFGGEECSYRVSLFVNHQPVEVFSGAKYVDVTMKDEQMAIVNLDFSKVLYSDYSCVYVIMCPLDSVASDADRLVEKTESITLFR